MLENFKVIFIYSCLGPLADVTLPVDTHTRRVKGFATVTFVMPDHAVAAYSALDGTVFMGRMLHLLPAKTKKTTEGRFTVLYMSGKLFFGHSFFDPIYQV